MTTTKKKKAKRLVGPIGEFAVNTLRALNEQAKIVSQMVVRLTSAEARITALEYARKEADEATQAVRVRLSAVEARRDAEEQRMEHEVLDRVTALEEQAQRQKEKPADKKRAGPWIVDGEQRRRMLVTTGPTLWAAQVLFVNASGMWHAATANRGSLGTHMDVSTAMLRCDEALRAEGWKLDEWTAPATSPEKPLWMKGDTRKCTLCGNDGDWHAQGNNNISQCRGYSPAEKNCNICHGDGVYAPMGRYIECPNCGPSVSRNPPTAAPAEKPAATSEEDRLRCRNPSVWWIHIGSYGGSGWCVCDEHRPLVLAKASPGMETSCRALKPDDGVLNTYVGERENRKQCQWDPVKHATKDVHTEHCCSKHGCKYLDANCTVLTGKGKQAYPCESCNEDAQIAAKHSDPSEEEARLCAAVVDAALAWRAAVVDPNADEDPIVLDNACEALRAHRAKKGGAS